MPYTVGNGFYASTLTLILVLTYFGKKNPKNLPHPKLLQMSKNGSDMLMKTIV
jgi:hypothetical protein